ncbi:MAG: FkbM family methyltransferase [Xanthobacteraceae bacterium]
MVRCDGMAHRRSICRCLRWEPSSPGSPAGLAPTKRRLRRSHRLHLPRKRPKLLLKSFRNRRTSWERSRPMSAGTERCRIWPATNASVGRCITMANGAFAKSNCCAFVKPGDTVLDIGANVGTHTIALGRLVGEQGTVLAFEGQPHIHSILAHNIVQNGMSKWVHAFNMLVGSASVWSHRRCCRLTR